MERKAGQFYSWNKRGFGFITVTPQERYFVHISEIFLDHIPEAGEQVTFEVAPPRGTGHLSCAVRVRAVHGGAQ